MSTLLLNNSITEDLLACRTCLTTERKLFSIHEYNISEAYKNLIGNEASPYDGLPQYICSYCSTLLLKFNIFRRNTQQAQFYLEDSKIILPNLLSKYHPVSLNRSDMNIIDTTLKENSETEIQTGLLDYEDIDSLSPTQINDIKIYTDILQIELPEKIKPKGQELDLKMLKGQISKGQSIEMDIKMPNDYSQGFDVDMLKPRGQEYEMDINIPKGQGQSVKTDKNIPKGQGQQFDIDIKMPTDQEFEVITKIPKGDSVKTGMTPKGQGQSEIDVNLKNFAQDFNVEVLVLTLEEQRRDVLERKLSSNYLHSPYKCELCYKGVMDEGALHKHYLYQHDPSRGSIVCELCSFRYKDNRGLNQHIKKSHRLKFACRQCSYVSRTTFNAKEHYKIHIGHKHKCRHCGKCHEKLSSHLTHLRIHHASVFIWCNICGEAFIGEFGLNAHKKRAHKYFLLTVACTSCKARFTTDYALKKHKKYENCLLSPCIHCGEGFDKDLDLRDHLIEKHRSLKIYECEKCDKTFTRQSLHAAHYKRAHVEDKNMKKVEKPWVCEVCGKMLPNRCMLLYHQRNHTGERPYQCTQCSKSFTMKRLLQSHLRVHTSDRPYTCKLCPKAFKGLSALRAHEHIHTGEQSRNRNIL